jgi:hypothetical protein
MKKLIHMCLVLASAFNLGAQGTTQFTAVLLDSRNMPLGQGMFALTNNVFTYRVDIGFYALWVSEIRGPSGPQGQEGILFDLDVLARIAPIGTNLGLCIFNGDLALTDSQIADLTANRWYVTASIPGFGADLRGQIQVVPEATVSLFLLLGGGVIGLRIWTRLSLWTITNSEFRLHISAVTNRCYRIETCTNLTNPSTWTPIHTNTVSFWYTNCATTSDWRRFYRVVTN